MVLFEILLCVFERTCSVRIYPFFIDVSSVNGDAPFLCKFSALFLVLTEFNALLVKVGDDCGQP